MKKLILPGIVFIVAAAIVAVSLIFPTEAPQTTNRVISIPAAEFQQKIEREPGIVIDVRTREEYDAGHLAVADLHYDLLNGDFEAHLDSLDKSETYYLYCRSGSRSGRAGKLMVENGFANVYNIGGYPDLVSAGQESE